MKKLMGRFGFRKDVAEQVMEGIISSVKDVRPDQEIIYLDAGKEMFAIVRNKFHKYFHLVWEEDGDLTSGVLYGYDKDKMWDALRSFNIPKSKLFTGPVW